MNSLNVVFCCISFRWTDSIPFPYHLLPSHITIWSDSLRCYISSVGTFPFVCLPCCPTLWIAAAHSVWCLLSRYLIYSFTFPVLPCHPFANLLLSVRSASYQVVVGLSLMLVWLPLRRFSNLGYPPPFTVFLEIAPESHKSNPDSTFLLLPTGTHPRE